MHPCQNCGQALENHIKICPRCEHSRVPSVGISREIEFSVGNYEEPEDLDNWNWTYVPLALILAMVLPLGLGFLAAGIPGLMFGSALAMVVFLLFSVATNGMFS